MFISVAIIGEYIGKIAIEIKSRPRFIISEIVGNIPNKKIQAVIVAIDARENILFRQTFFKPWPML